MTSSINHQPFKSPNRVSQSLSNDRCQNILLKAVFEHFVDLPKIAALLLASKSFQNSSFGANFLVNFVVDEKTLLLLESVLSPSSCFSLQFVPSLHIKQSKCGSEKINRDIANFVAEMINTKYFHLSMRSLTLDKTTEQVVLYFFGNSINSWPRLHHLKLEQLCLQDTVFEVIAKNAVQLRTLNLPRNSGITNVGIEHLSKLSGISSLNLTYCNEITDAGLEPLTSLSGITSLNLFGCRSIKDAGLERVAKLSGITFLNLSECCRITDAGLHAVSQLRNISSLNLSGCGKITDVGLEHVSRLFRITELHLIGCTNITDVGLQHVSKLSNITTLSVGWCNLITDAGLGNLSQLSSITSLMLSWCSKITAEAKIAFIQSKLPNCSIVD